MINRKRRLNALFALLSLMAITSITPAVAGDRGMMGNACQKGINATAMGVKGAEFMGPNRQRNQNKMMAAVMAADTMAEMRHFHDAGMQMNNVRDMIMDMADQQQPMMNAMDAFGRDMLADGNGGVEGMAAMAMNACQMQGMR